MSFTKLVSRIKSGLTEAAPEPHNRHEPLRLATAAVLLDIGYADGELSASEDEDLAGYLAGRFELSPGDTKELIEAAAEIRGRTIDHFALTSFIRKNATLEERIEIVKTMWRMVFSDGKLTDYENYLVRKLADLMGLEHHVMIAAKVSVLDEKAPDRHA
ncbi:MAG TPA: TerB family tellurite resistance protein [Thermoanaerobaculia bacterium]